MKTGRVHHIWCTLFLLILFIANYQRVISLSRGLKFVYSPTIQLFISKKTTVMRSFAIVLSCLFIVSFAKAQIFWTEDFSAGSAARGTSAVGYPGSSGGNWSQSILGAEGGSANNWYVSGEECGNAAGTCGSVCSNGDASLHISAVGGLCGTPDCGAAYDETSGANATNKRIESPNINTIGYGMLTLNFNYIAAQGDDGFTVEYSCDGGTSWNTLTTPTATQCCSCLDAFLCSFAGVCCAPQTQQSCAGGGQGYWTTFSMPLPVCTENISNLKIGFHWINDGNGIGTDPSVAIDDISIGSGIILPIELANFHAIAGLNENTLQWESASETNNSHFVIEHSFDGVSFSSIGRVNGQGTTTESHNYQFEHKNPMLGDNLYRLKQVDFDGNFAYSQTLLLRNELKEYQDWVIYPNPSTGKVYVNLSIKPENATLEVRDLSGRQVFSKLINESDIQFELNESPGFYAVSIISERGTLRKVLVLE